MLCADSGHDGRQDKALCGGSCAESSCYGGVYSACVFSRQDKYFSDKADPDGDTAPAVSALRTYFCILFFDISGVLGLMLAGALGVEWAKKAIIIFAPVVFVLAAIVYFILSGRIGLDDFSDSDGEE